MEITKDVAASYIRERYTFGFDRAMSQAKKGEKVFLTSWATKAVYGEEEGVVAYKWPYVTGDGNGVIFVDLDDEDYPYVAMLDETESDDWRYLEVEVID